tara:strand:- start:988 stop:1716 length:729 start_codon:yes stop_codon:yes gene_type:complete
MKGIKMAEETTQETVETNVSRETSEPTRPEWLPEKFKTGEDLVKSYENLETKLGQKDKDIREQVLAEAEAKRYENRPEKSGDYTLPKEIDEAQAVDNNLLQWWAGQAFDNGYSQEQFEEGIKIYVDAIDSLFPTEEEEQKKLGDNHKERIDAVGLFSKKYFPEELHNSVANLGTSADGIKVLEYVMNQQKENSLPVEGSQVAGTVSLEELQTKMKDPRYWNPSKQDPAFIKEIDDGFATLYG